MPFFDLTNLYLWVLRLLCSCDDFSCFHYFKSLFLYFNLSTLAFDGYPVNDCTYVYKNHNIAFSLKMCCTFFLCWEFHVFCPVMPEVLNKKDNLVLFILHYTNYCAFNGVMQYAVNQYLMVNCWAFHC